jgi:RHS repeat-associated protein
MKSAVTPKLRPRNRPPVRTKSSSIVCFEYQKQSQNLLPNINNPDASKKKDSVADETTLYYYNNNWQVLSETDANGATQRWFVYDNLLDEPLMMYVIGLDEDFESKYYYVQDALYSVRALVSAKGWVIEEQAVYNVYGQPTSWVSGDVDADGGLDAADVMAFYQSNGKSECDPNYNWRCDVDNSGQVNSTDIDALLRNWNEPIASNQLSLFTNPYFFTGRRVDILDNGSLKIQYNRNRYYDYYTGRWLTHDPLGITPNPQWPNVFIPAAQYTGEMSLYEAFCSDPLTNVDPWGLIMPPPGVPPPTLWPTPPGPVPLTPPDCPYGGCPSGWLDPLPSSGGPFDDWHELHAYIFFLMGGPGPYILGTLPGFAVDVLRPDEIEFSHESTFAHRLAARKGFYEWAMAPLLPAVCGIKSYSKENTMPTISVPVIAPLLAIPIPALNTVGRLQKTIP